SARRGGRGAAGRSRGGCVDGRDSAGRAAEGSSRFRRDCCRLCGSGTGLARSALRGGGDGAVAHEGGATRGGVVPCGLTRGPVPGRGGGGGSGGGCGLGGGSRVRTAEPDDGGAHLDGGALRHEELG